MVSNRANEGAHERTANSDRLLVDRAQQVLHALGPLEHGVFL